jgi:DNA-directed RNA polymerase subunit RPC12/RpoP
MAEEYKCAMCGGVFEKTVAEDDALAKLYEQFGEDVAVEDCDIVCDDCWQKARPDNPQNKEIFEGWLANQSLDSDTKSSGD